MPDFSLAGKYILITGASSGIGRAAAVACSRMGAKIIGTARDRGRLEETLSLLSGEGHAVHSADQRNPAEIGVLAEMLPKLDGIVHCAGTTDTIPCRHMAYERLLALFETNFFGTVNLMTALMQGKKISKGASIVFISSFLADSVAETGSAAYASAKAAMAAYARVLAKEVALRKIRVNTLMPGIVRTGLLQKMTFTEVEFNENEKLYPFGYGTPEDIADFIVFLLSPASRWMTGQKIVIDGGRTLN